jgi:2-keto-4-pentenoate hydratase/2-oxohepta-3-ene-1,7-dioic acid hydratase in catechol pathway
LNGHVRLTTGESRSVGTVYCLGRNYAEHAKEMGAAPDPVVFIKPAAAVVGAVSTVELPPGCERIEHEIELVLLVGQGAPETAPECAAESIVAVGIGIDLTARDLQAWAKDRGAPWARAKGFPGSAPVSAMIPRDHLEVGLDAIDLSLTVAGETRQDGSTSRMILSASEIIAKLSAWFPLQAGDLVFTGTPEGVGPIAPGQTAIGTSRALDLEVSVTVGKPA